MKQTGVVKRLLQIGASKEMKRDEEGKAVWPNSASYPNDKVIDQAQQLFGEWTTLCDDKCQFRVRPPAQESEEWHPYSTEIWNNLSEFRVTFEIYAESLQQQVHVASWVFGRQPGATWTPLSTTPVDQKKARDVKHHAPYLPNIWPILQELAKEEQHDDTILGMMQLLRYLRYYTKCNVKFMFSAVSPLYPVRAQLESLEFRRPDRRVWQALYSDLQRICQWRLCSEDRVIVQPQIATLFVIRPLSEQ